MDWSVRDAWHLGVELLARRNEAGRAQSRMRFRPDHAAAHRRGGEQRDASGDHLRHNHRSRERAVAARRFAGRPGPHARVGRQPFPAGAWLRLPIQTLDREQRDAEPPLGIRSRNRGSSNTIRG